MKKYLFLYVGVLSLLLAGNTKAQELKHFEKPITMDSSNQTNGFACLLTGQSLAKRLTQLKQDVFSKAEKEEKVENGYIFRFPEDVKFAINLTDYILAERSCCPFFRFDLSFSAYQQGIILKISGPPEAKAMIGEFLKDLE